MSAVTKMDDDNKTIHNFSRQLEAKKYSRSVGHVGTEQISVLSKNVSDITVDYGSRKSFQDAANSVHIDKFYSQR
jgi:hypothetical protein